MAHCLASLYAETLSFGDFTWTIDTFNVAEGKGTRVVVGANVVNAGTIVIEITILNFCASGVDLSAAH